MPGLPSVGGATAAPPSRHRPAHARSRPDGYAERRTACSEAFPLGLCDAWATAFVLNDRCRAGDECYVAASLPVAPHELPRAPYAILARRKAP